MPKPPTWTLNHTWPGTDLYLEAPSTLLAMDALGIVYSVVYATQAATLLLALVPTAYLPFPAQFISVFSVA